MIELDGSYEEGGGQILRTALGLSILTQKAFRIINIRKNRPKPGLRAQHLYCVKACAEFSNAYVEGATLGSETIEFIPKTIKNRQLEINIGTAGSTTLLMQSLLIPIMFTECDLRIFGGTDVKWSMPIDYAINVLSEVLLSFTNINIKCEKRGYYPKGGGIIKISTKPKIKRIDFDNFDKFHQYSFGNPALDLFSLGKLMSIKGISHASINLQDKEVAERQAKSVEIALKNKYPVNIDKQYANTDSTGSGITIYAIYGFPGKEKQYRLGSDMLGEERMKAEEVGRIACDKLIKYINADVQTDEHLQDNIIPLLGLFGGRIRTGFITPHTKANIHVCEQFLDVEYEITKDTFYNNINENKSIQREANFISVLSSKRP
jgi:RNA 3'-phosphate cyclase